MFYHSVKKSLLVEHNVPINVFPQRGWADLPPGNLTLKILGLIPYPCDTTHVYKKNHLNVPSNLDMSS